jgi:hypothetical protein
MAMKKGAEDAQREDQDPGESQDPSNADRQSDQ